MAQVGERRGRTSWWAAEPAASVVWGFGWKLIELNNDGSYIGTKYGNGTDVFASLPYADIAGSLSGFFKECKYDVATDTYEASSAEQPGIFSGYRIPNASESLNDGDKYVPVSGTVEAARVTDLSANGADDQWTLLWTLPSGGPYDSIEVHRGTTLGGAKSLLSPSAAGNATSYAVTIPTQDQGYYYAIKLVKGAWKSEFSNEVELLWSSGVQQTEFFPIHDSYIRSGQFATNNWDGLTIELQDNTFNVDYSRFPVFAFDLAANQVNSAELRLFIENFQVEDLDRYPQTFKVKEIDGDFIETQVNYNEKSTGVAWDVPTALAGASIGSGSISGPAAIGTNITVTLTFPATRTGKIGLILDSDPHVVGLGNYTSSRSIITAKNSSTNKPKLIKLT